MMLLLLLQPVHLTERAESTLADCTVSNQQDHREKMPVVIVLQSYFKHICHFALEKKKA